MSEEKNIIINSEDSEDSDIEDIEDSDNEDKSEPWIRHTRFGFNNYIPASYVDDDENWKNGNENWIHDGISWVREGKYEKEKNITVKYKNFIIKEMNERTRRFIKLYDYSFIDNIYDEHERSIELITLPLKHSINKYYKKLYKEQVKEYFLKDEKEDFLTIKPEKAKEKLNKIMKNYKDKVRRDVKEKLNEGNLFFF